MSNSKVKTRNRLAKPRKPYADFPLTPHNSGSWMKKINGRLFYFGRWARQVKGKLERLPDDGWQQALQLYKAQADDLHAGREPREKRDGDVTLKQICNEFLTAKQNRVVSDELSPRSFSDYRDIAQMVCDFFGKHRLVSDLRPDDFAALRLSIAKRCGPVRLGNEVTRVKGIFKFAVANQLIEKEVVFGTEFQKPRKEVMQKHKASRDKKLFTPFEIRQLMEARNFNLQVAVLLGINCGLGNTDISNLDQKHLDLDRGWLDYPRSKNGMGRRVPLWPVTVEYLRKAIGERPSAKNKADDGAVLLTRNRERLIRLTEVSRIDGLARGFSELMSKLEINGRQGLGFYSLRHTFATVALQTGDRDSVKSLMGHSAGDILAVYDETGPSDARLQAVTEHVRSWLFSIPTPTKGQ